MLEHLLSPFPLQEVVDGWIIFSREREKQKLVVLVRQEPQNVLAARPIA
jgi:hypothetical protein